jgi:large subunit ribosomal protein L21
MNSYAIIQASGKQFWVEENKFYDFDKMPLQQNDVFCFNKILLLKRGGSVNVGKPFLSNNFIVEAIVLRHFKSSKVRVFKMKAKKNNRKVFGNKNDITRVLIKRIMKV